MGKHPIRGASSPVPESQWMETSGPWWLSASPFPDLSSSPHTPGTTSWGVRGGGLQVGPQPAVATCPWLPFGSKCELIQMLIFEACYFNLIKAKFTYRERKIVSEELHEL